MELRGCTDADHDDINEVPPALWAQVVWSVSSSNLHFFRFGEEFTSPSIPSPWVCTGRPASRQRVQDGQIWLRRSLREPKIASRMAQDSARSLQMASYMLQEAPPDQSKTGPSAIQCSAMLTQRSAMQSHAMLRNVMQCYAMLRYAMKCK